MKITKYLAWIFGVICGAELVVGIALGGAGASVIYGTEGLIVTAFLTLGAALTIVGWTYRRSRVLAINTPAKTHQD
jgi:hypothetical protein